MIDVAKVRAAIEPIPADHAVVETEFVASIAISLKRIADSLDNPGQSSGSVLYWLEIIASAANAGRS